jgi:hypothetical protein
MDFYAKAPGRLLAQNAPRSVPPPPLQLDEGPLPIDDGDEGCDTPGDKPHKAWTREIETLTVAPGDVISDRGEEIYNVFQQRHIDTVLYMGVHANMCILNRNFGIRQMSKWGLRCILVRDLTDKPKKAPCLQRGDEFGIVESSRRFSLQTPNFLLYNVDALMFAASAYRKPMCADVWL